MFTRFAVASFRQTRAFFTIGLTGGIASGESLFPLYSFRLDEAQTLFIACEFKQKRLRVIEKIGKSNIARDLSELGATVIDADKLGHESYLPDTSTYNDIVAHFGSDLVKEDRTIDRAKLGQLVFGDANKMRELTDIVWPAIRAAAEKRISDERARGAEVVVLEAAVLLEAGWDDAVDRVWVATVPRDVAIARLAARNQLSAVDAARRIDAQLSNEARIARADVVINTNRERSETKALVQQQFAAECERWRQQGRKNRSKQ